MLDTTRRATACITVGTEVLFDALRRVKHAMSTEQTRYYLCGVYMHVDAGKLAFVATDGHRLARVAVDFEEDAERLLPAPVILPETFIADVLKVKKTHSAFACRLEVAADLVRCFVPVRDGDAVLVECKPIDGAYPDYKSVIPQAERLERQYTVNTEALLQTMAAFSAMGAAVDNKSAHVKLTFSGSELLVGVGWGGITATAKHETKEATKEDSFEVGVSARLLRDILKSFSAGAVKLKFSDNLSPIVIESDWASDARGFAVLMPCRV